MSFVLASVDHSRGTSPFPTVPQLPKLQRENTRAASPAWAVHCLTLHRSVTCTGIHSCALSTATVFKQHAGKVSSLNHSFKHNRVFKILKIPMYGFYNILPSCACNRIQEAVKFVHLRMEVMIRKGIGNKSLCSIVKYNFA